MSPFTAASCATESCIYETELGDCSGGCNVLRASMQKACASAMKEAGITLSPTDQSESGSCSPGQVISALCLLPQSLETVLPGVPGVMEPVYVACLCHQSLKHCP